MNTRKNKNILTRNGIIILFFLLTFIFPLAGIADNKTITKVAHHTIAISFDLENSLLTGTSQITLPAGKTLALDFGFLEITGSILKQQDRTPLQPIVDSNNIIHIGKQESEQILLTSWTMKADQPMATSNLISKQGITLAGFWHPIPDLDMTYALHAALPDGFTGISEGEKVEIVTVNNIRQLQTSFPHPIRSINFAAGDYIIRSIQVGRVSLYTYFFPEDDHLSQGYLEKGAEFIKRYEKLIGPFPYSRYAIVANRLPTGYGMPGFTLLGQAVIRLPFIKYTSLGHEILHSWFGNSIGLAEGSGNWCEGLTTYFADHSFAVDLGKGVEFRKNQLLRYQAFVHKDNTMTLVDFIGAADRQPRATAKKIRAIGYNKSSMVFHMLSKKIGEENFIRGLQEFYSRKKHQRASWQDIENIFSEISGQDLSIFFEQWLKRSDIPKLNLKDISVAQRNGQSLTTFTLTQTNRNNIPYLLKVPVTIKTISGTETEEFIINQQQQTFTIITDTLPLKIIIDKNYDIFRDLSYQETPPTWAGFLGRKQKYIILPDDKQQAAIYQSLVAMLSLYGVKATTVSQVSNRELGKASFIFAGDSELKRTIFAGSDNKEINKNKKSGFTLQVRKNPLNQSQYMVIVDASGKDEVRAAARKLPHYGKYSSLSFALGKLVEKNIEPAENGIVVPLLELPSGIPAQQVKNFTDIIKDISKSRVIYVGETHIEYSHHVLQLKVIQALHAKKTKDGKGKNKIAIGMEMFPRSAQPVLDDYISGRIETEKEFLKRSDYFSVWGFDYRLYRNIINFARKNRIPIIALNLERHITRQVFRSGNTDILSPADRENIAREIDLDAPNYGQRLRVVYDVHASFIRDHTPRFSGFIQAQALWDETMAESISNYLKRYPQKTMVVIVGSGHVYKDSAIPLRVERRIPGIRQSVLVSHDGVDTGQEIGRQVDYLIFTRAAELPPEAKIGVVLQQEKPKEGEQTKMRVAKFSPHSHGLEAGLLKGDIIIGVNGEPVHEVADIRIALLDKIAGDTVNLEIYREQAGDRSKTIMITLELTYARFLGMVR